MSLRSVVNDETSTPADWSSERTQQTWIAFAPIIKAVIGYVLVVATCCWCAAIIEELWTRSVPVMSLTFGLFGMGIAFTLAYFFGAIAAGFALASVSIVNGSLRNFLKPKTAGLLGGGLAAYLLTLPFVVNAIEGGSTPFPAVLLAGPVTLTAFVYIAISWRFRREELMAAADTLIGSPIDRRSLQAAVVSARRKTGRRWLRPLPREPVPNLQAVHPLDRVDDEDSGTPLREPQAGMLKTKTGRVSEDHNPSQRKSLAHVSRRYRSDQWTTRQVFVLTVWIAVPLGIIVACGGAETGTVSTIGAGFVLCQVIAFVVAKLLSLPMGWFLNRQVVKYITR